MKPITVLIAENNRFVRKAFREMLDREPDIEVIGEAEDGLQALRMVKKHSPAVVLMEIAMPRENGLQAARRILDAATSTRVLMLSVHTEEAYVEEALKAGASGYLIKHTSTAKLRHAIREVQKGNTFFSPSIPRRLHKRAGREV